MKPAFSTLIHRIRLNSREDLHFELQQDGFRIRLDLRVWKRDPRNSRYRPSSKGLNLSRDQLGDVVAGLQLWGLRAQAWNQGLSALSSNRSVMVQEESSRASQCGD